jgi:hypothetical protein
MTQLSLAPPAKPNGFYVLSAKLQRTLAALRHAGAAGLTTRELGYITASCGVAQDVWHLRRHGVKVTCDHDGTSERGARVSRWRLVE